MYIKYIHTVNPGLEVDLAGPLLAILIDGCKLDHLQEKLDKKGQKKVKEVSGLKNDGCMHPLPKIDGCSCTRSNEGPV